MSYRAYRLPSPGNVGKHDAVAALLPVWQAGLGRSQAALVQAFFTTGVLPKYLDEQAKTWSTGPGGVLSQRQWNSVNAQAIAAHRSWLGNCERVFRRLVANSKLPAPVRADLFYLNKAHAWYRPVTGDAVTMDPTGQPVVAMSKKRAIPVGVFTVARQIMRAVHRRVGRPDLRRVRTMVMDGKIAMVRPSNTPAADFWVRISTLTRGQPVLVPLRTQAAFTARLGRAGGKVANHCQIVVGRPDRHGQCAVTYRLVIDSEPAPPRDQGRTIGLDWGMATLFATSDGRLFGRGFLTQLQAYDQRLQPLVKALAKAKIKLRDSRRYRTLVQDIRGYVSNEIGRVLNRIAADPDLRELVVEELDLRGMGMSRRMRRLVSLAGRATVTRKLAALQEDHGITITEVNPAHTSRQCISCGYTHKDNRTSQAHFKCRFCGKKVHADIGGARTIVGRSHNDQHWPNLGRGQVLTALDVRFQARWGLTYAQAEQRRRNRTTSRVSPLRPQGQRNELPLVS